MSNPLQQYFRQPKIYIKLPSGGIFNKIGSLQGDVTNMPVYGMTGMDEIIMKTPDALLSGESTAQVIASCCANIKDPWSLSAIDVPLILAAIRIATYGAELPVTHSCPKCQAENSYDIDLTAHIDFYNKCKYDNQLKIGNITINLQPLTYKQTTEFALRNFQLQQRLAQAEKLEDEQEQNKIIKDLFEEMGKIQNEIYIANIESVATPAGTVTDITYITEFIQNCDADIFAAIKNHNDTTRDTWSMPKQLLKCDSCGHESQVKVELDQSNFFDKA